MSLRNTFQGMSSWSQLLFLGLFSFLGLFIVSLLIGIASAVYAFMNGNLNDIMSIMQSVNFMRITQFFSTIFMFLIPALLCAYLYNDRPLEYLKVNKPLDPKFTVISIGLIFIVQPIISFLSYYNEKLKLPEFMNGIENWMQKMEKANAATMDFLMAGNSVTVLIINLIIIAVMAGLTEEIFFRGSMQQIFNKISNNYHVAVWVTAFIFSAIHLQFYGFVPRLLLGALLGYLFVWSRNLWVPIIVHFINNAMGVIIYWRFHGTPEYQKIEDMGVNDLWWATLLSVILTSVIIAFLLNEYNRKHKYAEF